MSRICIVLDYNIIVNKVKDARQGDHYTVLNAPQILAQYIDFVLIQIVLCNIYKNVCIHLHW